MNNNRHMLFKGLLFFFGGLACQGQQSKSVTERFPTTEETRMEINTSYADLEFETWDKDMVEITAVVELEGATEQEVESYFKRDLIEIMGNSREIQVRTQGGSPNEHQFASMAWEAGEFPALAQRLAEIEIPEFPKLDVLPEISVIPSMPPIPSMPFVAFDYQAYEKDKEKYMQQWKKEFDKTFDEEFKIKFEAWGEELEQRMKQWEENREKMAQRRKEMQADREELRKEREQNHRELSKSLRERTRAWREQNGQNGPNFYFYTKDGDNKTYEVKKRIKIKMPKYLKLNLNVRHGEVKLASNALNIKARLSYSKLMANTIEGGQTDIRASYSPVTVQEWNLGTLKTDFSDRVDLRVVKELDLISNASQVAIGTLIDRAQLNNTFGSLKIGKLADGFQALDIKVVNGELELRLPSIPYDIAIQKTESELQYPKSLKLEASSRSDLLKGHHINAKGSRSISIASEYSELVLLD